MDPRATAGVIKAQHLGCSTSRALTLTALSAVGLGYSTTLQSRLGFTIPFIGGIGDRSAFRFLISDRWIAARIKHRLQTWSRGDVLRILRQTEQGARTLARHMLAEKLAPYERLRRIAEAYPDYMTCLGVVNSFWRYTSVHHDVRQLTPALLTSMGTSRDTIAHYYPMIDRVYRRVAAHVGPGLGLTRDSLTLTTIAELRRIVEERRVPQPLRRELAARAKGYVYLLSRDAAREEVTSDPAVIRAVTTLLETRDDQKVLHGQGLGRRTIDGVVVLHRQLRRKALPPRAILVTPMTHPSDLPLLKRCVGLVTDEGGLALPCGYRRT